MSSQIKPIKIWGQGGPNPPKVAFIVAELGLPHEVIPLPLSDVKNPEYLAINPNGRIPAIHDPNTGITLWESGAIVEYLIERYDTERQLSFPPATQESYHAKQWSYFQASGQGPYYGQAAWFKKFHSEQVPSAIERYNAEVNRVTGVLEGYLAQQKNEGVEDDSDGPWLVGNKFSYADIVFISWQVVIGVILDKDQYDIDNFPQVKDWIGRMTSRPTVAAVLEKAFKQ